MLWFSWSVGIVSYFCIGTCNGIFFCRAISVSSQSHICLSFWLILVLEDLADTFKRKSIVQKTVYRIKKQKERKNTRDTIHPNNWVTSASIKGGGEVVLQPLTSVSQINLAIRRCSVSNVLICLKLNVPTNIGLHEVPSPPAPWRHIKINCIIPFYPNQVFNHWVPALWLDDY